MRVTVPIYVRQFKPEDAPAARFLARPLFRNDLARGGAVLSRALARLAGDIRRHLANLGKKPHQEELAAWTFNPALERHTLDQSFILRRRTIRTKVMAAAFRSGSSHLGLIPQIDLWFDIPSGRSLSSRAEEVLTEHLQKLEKDDPKFDAETLLGGNVLGLMLTSLDVDIELNPVLPKKDERPMFMLGGASPADGNSELYRVGRLLDSLYPDDLDEAVLRDQEVDVLSRRLTDPNRPPVLVLGPRGVGKTAVVHQFVRRRLHNATAASREKHHTWLISPQRLISGMSYVGQWEDRLLAILNAAKKHDHILCFDDVLGLYLAGQHSRSTLSVADVMRPMLERREFRFLAEMTPESYRVLRERDRAMADLLEVLPVREPTAGQARKILVSVERQLENRHRCTFELEALPTVVDLQRRYIRDVSMPGKAAVLLHRLAGGNAGKSIDRAMALEAFGAYSGLSMEFLDSSSRLRRGDVVGALAARVVGQPAAVEAMADAVCVAKARLNDVARPIATFLFLGPTGVGKTECAKALAGYLFGNTAGTRSAPSVPGDDRLLRFDMNEYVDDAAAGRLIGTFSDPEGLLTAAVRRQPFGVVLFDEIEKAHPAVFDLLLAVLGEGRLTDARGRTADFTNTIIVMTSNLGVREAGTSFGLRTGGTADAEAHARYRDAAQRFFRPEFYNRIDRVVPFDRLGREDVANIARRLMDGLLNREGLTGRRCMLRVDAAALQRIVDAGYHPQLGARALKREVEKRIAAPVAARLATMTPGEPAVIDVMPSAGPVDRTVDGAASLQVRVTPIRPATPLPPMRSQLLDPAWNDPEQRTQLLDDLLDSAEVALAELEQRIEALSPGGMTQGRLSSAHFAYLALREQVKVTAGAIGRLDGAVESSIHPPPRNYRKGGRHPQRPEGFPQPMRWVPSTSEAWIQVLSGQSISMPENAEPVDDHDRRLRSLACVLLDEMALLQAMSKSAIDVAEPQAGDHGDQVDPHRALLVLRSQADASTLARLAAAFVEAFQRQLGVTVEDLTVSESARRRGRGDAASLPSAVRALLADLPSAATVLCGEIGTHLYIAAGDSRLMPIEAHLHPLREGADPMLVAQQLAAHMPESINPPLVVRAYGAGSTLDLRSGLAAEAAIDGATLRRMILAALPVSL